LGLNHVPQRGVSAHPIFEDIGDQNDGPNFRFWLSAAQLIATIERPLCDPIADVHDIELE
jgi:hypothetical protein